MRINHFFDFINPDLILGIVYFFFQILNNTFKDDLPFVRDNINTVFLKSVNK